MNGERLARHDTATWLGTHSMLIQLAEVGYDFTTAEGSDVLEEARQSLVKIQAQLAGEPRQEP